MTEYDIMLPSLCHLSHMATLNKITTVVILCTTLNDTEKLLLICQEEAKDFIGKAVNISKADYTSSDVDILYAEHVTYSNELS
ncbi:hypothetical protein Tco_0837559, partial [Tanacetum coccineum]